MNQCISDYIPEPNDDDHIIITFEKSANWHRARCGDLVTGWYREQRQAVDAINNLIDESQDNEEVELPWH